MKTLEEVLPQLTAPGAPFELDVRDIGSRKGLRCWKHGPKTGRDVWEATKSHDPNSEYMVYYGDGNKSVVRITYGQARETVAKLAHAMRHRFGLKKGDRVGIAMRNYPQFPLIFFAALSIGLICVPYNAWLLSEELLYCVNDSGASVIFVDPEREARLEPVKEKLKTVKNVVFVRSGADEDRAKKMNWADVDFEELVASTPKVEMPYENVEPEDHSTMWGRGLTCLGNHHRRR